MTEVFTTTEHGVYNVVLKTVFSGSKRARRRRARIQALSEAGIFDKTVAQLKELPSDRIESPTEVVGERVMDESLGTKTWMISVRVK